MPPGVFSSPHAWVLILAMGVVWAGLVWLMARGKLREKPGLAPGFRRILLGGLLGSSVPLLIAAVGLELGAIPNFLAIWRPPNGNPYILAMMASVVVLWLALLYWVFFRRGAEFLADHAELLNGGGNPTPTMVRLFVCLVVLGGVAGMALSFSGLLDLPAERFSNKGR